MSEHVYKVIELVGSAPDSIEAAIDNALARASQSLHNLRWFEITETPGQIEDGRVRWSHIVGQLGSAVKVYSGAAKKT